MVNFFIRVVFLAEPDDFEIMKSRKKRLDFHMSEYILRVGDHMPTTEAGPNFYRL